MAVIEKIISGSQNGADRASLDWAIRHGIPHGGWCPKGRKEEHGAIVVLAIRRILRQISLP
jgi:hypothetical protein